MSDDKSLGAVVEDEGRDLPPLDTEESKSKSSGSAGSTAKIIKRVIIGFGIFVVLVIVAAVLVFSTAETASKEAPKSALEIVGEGSALEALNPLLVDVGLEQSTYESNDKEDLIPPVGGNETDALPEFDLGGTVEEVRGLQDQLTGVTSELDQVSGQFILMNDQFSSVVAQTEQSLDRVVALEKQVAYLVKELKRLKWVERQKRVARKKVSNKPSLSVKSFFIWQYRPGVEIELSSGISERFYEGDLLDGMRLVRIDVDNEEVTLSKGAKRIVLKKQAGG